MIYVSVEAKKSEGRGYARGNGWHDTDNPVEAIAREMEKFTRTWNRLGHGTITTYRIVVAPDASPRRTTQGKPLPVRAES